METLSQLGWNPFFSQQLELDDLEYEPFRVVSEQKDLYRVLGESGEFWAVLSGRLRHGILENRDRPAVGDWVLLDGGQEADRKIVKKVLDRKSALVRGRIDSNRLNSAGLRAQVLAANVDTVFIAESLTGNFSLNRLERYTALARQAGAWPVVLLTKADLVPEDDREEDEISGRLALMDPIRVSAKNGRGLDLVRGYLTAGGTSVLLGPSGAGKSTLINALLGAVLQTEGEVRAADDKGRHTTTSRQMFHLPEGGLIIDTPGLRAIGLVEGEPGVRTAFDEVEQLARECRFKDCRHLTEPGCAVRRAVEDGRLDRARYENYLTLIKESQSLEIRSSPSGAKKQGRRMAKMQAEVKKTDKSRFFK